MKHGIVFLFYVLASSAAVYGQSGPGSLEGTVSATNGAHLADAAIQAKNQATGAVTRTLSKADGRYALPNLPAGKYEISARMPCCAFVPFIKSDVVVNAGAVSQFNMVIAEGGSLTTYGDDPGRLTAMLRKRSNVPKRASPRTRDGTPDFSGVWLVNRDLYPEKVEALPWEGPPGFRQIFLDGR